MKRYLFLVFILSFAFVDASDRRLILNTELNLRNALGSRAILSLPRETGTSEGCFIMKPDGSLLPVSADTQYPGISWYFRPNSLFICSVEIGPFDATMFGKWTLLGWFNNNGVLFETQQPANIAEEGGDVALAPLQYLTNIGATIDISLNETFVSGTCGISTPDGGYHAFHEDLDVKGVTIHAGDNFVKCRASIGPMTEELLGAWTLILLKADHTHILQPVFFTWANPTNPEAEAWEIATAVPQSFVTALGSSVNISVSRIDTGGFFKGCALTTPAGVTIPVYYRYYPKIAFTLANRVSACIITLGPLDEEMFGRWILAAYYEVDGTLVESRQPLTVRRHDGISRLPLIRHFTNIGAVVDINLSQTGSSGSCRLRSPAGIEYSLSGSTLAGVTVHSSSNIVTCRVTIGPMTATLLGEWSLIQQNVDQTQRIQSVNIAWSDPSNPTQQARRLTIPAPQTMATDIGGIVPISAIRQEGFFEGCFLTIPDGATIPVFENIQYPGVTHDGANRLNGCFIEIGPIDKNMLGSWILRAHYNDHGIRSESQQIMNILEDDLITTLPILRHSTHLNEIVDINLYQNRISGICVLRNQLGIEYTLDSHTELEGVIVEKSSKFVSCRVLIGPLSNSFLGDWILIHRSEGQRERRQPVSIQWANPLTPSQPSAQIITASEQNTVVRFGNSENIYVGWQSGNLLGCWITTPNGEVLPLSAEANYPDITWSRANSEWACTAILGPIDDGMIGRWILSGRFENNGIFMEAQHPVILSRNTEIESALPVLQFWTNTGAILDLSLNNTEQAFDRCRLITPTRDIYTLDEDFELNGVTLEKNSKFVSCRVTIGPMKNELLGEWTLIQESSNQWYRRQAAVISWSNPQNPSQEVWHYIKSQSQESVVNIGDFIDSFVSREEGFFEGCFITTPDGTVLPLYPSYTYPGITHTGVNRLTACFIELGPVDHDLEGRWILSARFNNAGQRFESQVPIILTIGDGITRLPSITYVTNVGKLIDLNLNNTGNNGACHLTTPTGQNYSLNSNIDVPLVKILPRDAFVHCAVRIGPVNEAALGLWTLSENNADQIFRQQPLLISWANPHDPAAESRELIQLEDQLYFTRQGSVVPLAMQRQDGLFEGCFLTTPQGITLPLFPENQYAGISHIGQNRVTACFIELGPIDGYMQGTWTVNARFLHYEDGSRVEYRQQVHLEFSRGSSSMIAWIITFCVVSSLVAAVVGVLTVRKSRVWTQNRFQTLRSSFRSTASRADLTMNEYSMPENNLTVPQARNPAVLNVNQNSVDSQNFDPLGVRRV